MAATTSADALTQLQQYQGSLQTPQQAMDAANSALGVSGAKQTATGLQGAIQNTTNLLGQVAPSVYGRTGNSLVTTAQAGKQIDNESAPLQSTLEKQGTDYSNAEDNYKDLVGQAENQAQNTLTDQTGRLSGLQSIYSDLYGKEQDAAAEAEKEREFNASLDASNKAASAANGLSGLGSLSSGDSTAAAPSAASALSGGKTSAQAQTAVANLLRSDQNTIINTYKAIVASANHGNTYDQAKIQFIKAAAPGLFKNQGYLQGIS